eukprot:12071883-Heterocapsa_arctica.AAC.1
MAATFAGRLLSRLALFAGGPDGGDALSLGRVAAPGDLRVACGAARRQGVHVRGRGGLAVR